MVGLGVNNCASVTTTKGELVQEIAVRCPRGTKSEAMGWVGARAWPPRHAQLDKIRTSSRTPWEVWPDDEEVAHLHMPSALRRLARRALTCKPFDLRQERAWTSAMACGTDMGLQRVGVRRAPDEMSLPHKQSNRGRGPQDATKYPSLSNDQVFCIRLWSYKYDLYQAHVSG